jgi:hypothetical protein
MAPANRPGAPRKYGASHGTPSWPTSRREPTPLTRECSAMNACAVAHIRFDARTQARLFFIALSLAACSASSLINKQPLGAPMLARYKVLSLRGGEVEFGDFAMVEKVDLVLGAMYAVQCLAMPQFFNEQTYGETDSSDTSKSNLQYCGMAIVMLKYMQYNVFKYAPAKVKAQQGLGWAGFAALSASLLGKFNNFKGLKMNLGLQAIMSAVYAKRLMDA